MHTITGGFCSHCAASSASRISTTTLLASLAGQISGLSVQLMTRGYFA